MKLSDTVFLRMKCFCGIIDTRWRKAAFRFGDANLNKGETVEMMKRSDESDHWIVEEVSGIGVPSYKSNHWVVEKESGIGVPSYKSKSFYTAWVACALLLLVHLVIIGCGPLTSDQQSNLPFEDSGVQIHAPKKYGPWNGRSSATRSIVLQQIRTMYGLQQRVGFHAGTVNRISGTTIRWKMGWRTIW